MMNDDGPRRPDRTRPVRATSRSDVESDVSLTVYAFVVVAFEAALGAPRRANRRAVGSATDRCVAPRELGSAAEISVETDTDGTEYEESAPIVETPRPSAASIDPSRVIV